jgi:hypothetical protein
VGSSDVIIHVINFRDQLDKASKPAIKKKPAKKKPAENRW